MITEDELVVLDHLTEAWNAFLKLEVMHPQHQPEFMHTIHEAQRLVLARAGLRDLAQRKDEL
jgi:hypothetical protein